MKMVHLEFDKCEKESKGFCLWRLCVSEQLWYFCCICCSDTIDCNWMYIHRGARRKRSTIFDVRLAQPVQTPDTNRCLMRSGSLWRCADSNVGGAGKQWRTASLRRTSSHCGRRDMWRNLLASKSRIVFAECLHYARYIECASICVHYAFKQRYTIIASKSIAAQARHEPAKAFRERFGVYPER